MRRGRRTGGPGACRKRRAVIVDLALNPLTANALLSSVGAVAVLLVLFETGLLVGFLLPDDMLTPVRAARGGARYWGRTSTAPRRAEHGPAARYWNTSMRGT